MNDQNPKVTVVVPAYNHQEYVKGCLESILAQTYQNFELIVIDDCSSDKTPSIAKELSDLHGFKLIVHESNKGLVNTLNEGLSIAKGEFFCVLASDDEWVKEKLQLQLDHMTSNPDHALCYGEIQNLTESGVLKDRVKSNRQSADAFKGLLLKEFFIPAPTVMTKTAVLREMGGFSDKYWIEDLPMWLKVAQKYSLGQINEVLAYRRIHGKNMSLNVVRRLEDQRKIIEDYKDSRWYDKAISAWHLRAFALLSRNHKKDALKHLAPSMRYFYSGKFLKSLAKLLR